MKKLLLLLLLFLLSGKFLIPQETPDSIKSFKGIPILTYLDDELKYIQDENFYKKMDSAGIYATEITDMNSSYMQFLIGSKFKILPAQMDPSLKRGIMKYSSARYSIWKAAGTIPATGEATLYRDNTIGEIFDGIVRTKTGQGVVNKTLIYGPFYRQDARDTNWISYRADFQLKKENISNSIPSPNSIVCVLQVTTSHAIDSLPDYPIDSTFVIDSLVITYSMLADTFKTFYITYD